MVVIAAPVGTNMILSRGVGDVITGIGAIHLLRVVACHQVLPERMIVLSLEDAEAPRPAAKFGCILILSPTVVGCGPLVIACHTDERWQVGGIAGE